MSQITIKFRTPEQKAGFMRLYQGSPGFFGQRNPNYIFPGQVREDRTLGARFAEWVYLEREYIQDFVKLGQDVAMFGGEII